MIRNETIDNLKGIGIIFVVIGHLTKDPLLYQYIYSFHMPLFFIVSGFLSFGTIKDKNLLRYIKRKTKTIILPYMIFCLISTIVACLYGNKFNFILFIKGIFLQGNYLASNIHNFPLWFLPAFFLVTNIFLLIFKICHNKNLFVIIILFVIGGLVPFVNEKIFLQFNTEVFPLALNVLMPGVFFMGIGYSIARYKIIFEKLLRNKSVLVMLFGVSIYISSHMAGSIMMILSYKYFLEAIASYAIYYKIAFSIKSNTLNWIGQKSLYIMGLHDIVATAYWNSTYHKLIINLYHGSIMQLIIDASIVLVITTLVIYVWDFIISNGRKVIYIEKIL